jgi:hypothetical protein
MQQIISDKNNKWQIISTNKIKIHHTQLNLHFISSLEFLSANIITTTITFSVQSDLSVFTGRRAG